jgi:ABC-2 type transport system ATP-binding protein
VISATQLTRRYGSRTVVRDVSLAVERSEIVALLGPNGAGKTTTMRMMAGMISPTSGSVVIDGVRLTRATAAQLRARIGFLPEAPGLWDRLSVRENLAIYGDLYGLDRAARTIDRLLEMFNLLTHAEMRAAELSKGMRQKVALARALLHNPHILLLDEPTSGLDPEIIKSVRSLLAERRAAGCAILLSTHNLDEAERLADRVAVIQERLVALDRPSSLRRRLTTGRLVVRVVGQASLWLDAARTIDPSATADNQTLLLKLASIDRDTPRLIKTMVSAGAEIVEVRPEIPALEDVYLHLVSDSPPDEDRAP